MGEETMTEERDTIARAAAALDDPGVTREAAPRAVDPLREALELLPCPFCGGKAELVEGDECAYVQCLDMKMHRAMFVDGDNAAGLEAAEQWNHRAALVAAPQPAPVDREKLVEVITEALYRHGDKGWTPIGSVNDIADALIAAGLRLPGSVPADETLAWAVIGKDGVVKPSTLAWDYDGAARREAGGEVTARVRVSIRRVEDEA